MNGLFHERRSLPGFHEYSPDTVNECEVNVNIMNIVNIFMAPVPRPAWVGAATNGAGGFWNLKGPTSVATFVMGARTFAIAACFEANGVQIIDVSDPQHPLAMGRATDGIDGFSMLSGAHSVATFSIETGTFAIVASYDEKGEQD